MHLVLLDGFAVGGKLWFLKFGDHIVAALAVTHQEEELMNEDLVVRVFVVWILHLLLVLQVLLNSLDVLLEVLPLLLVALEHTLVLMDPCAYQLVAHCFINQSERPLYYTLLQGYVCLLQLLLNQSERVYARTDILYREMISPVENEGSCHEFYIAHGLSVIQVL